LRITNGINGSIKNEEFTYVTKNGFEYVSSAKMVLARKFEVVHRKTVQSRRRIPSVCRHRECRHRFEEERSSRMEFMMEEARVAGLSERERSPLLSKEDGRFIVGSISMVWRARSVSV
jgi:hypothetical protein